MDVSLSDARHICSWASRCAHIYCLNDSPLLHISNVASIRKTMKGLFSDILVVQQVLVAKLVRVSWFQYLCVDSSNGTNTSVIAFCFVWFSVCSLLVRAFITLITVLSKDSRRICRVCLWCSATVAVPQFISELFLITSQQLLHLSWAPSQQVWRSYQKS